MTTTGARRATRAKTVNVVLLRGINVGGGRKLPMADLRQICVDVGGDDVATYIQSGNVVLRSSLGAGALEGAVERRISEVAGFDTDVIVRTLAEFDDVVSSGIYADEDDGTKRVVTFLKKKPAKDALAGLDLEAFAPESCTLRGREIYLHLPNGQGRAKLPDAIARATRSNPIPGTTRNWRTVEKLHAMAVALDRS
jgi:uncharacterized protein (DUF1697 family)